MAELHEIKGIGPATATQLAGHGLGTVKKLAKADLDEITAVPGFGPVRAAAVRAEARAAVPAKTAKTAKSTKAAKPTTSAKPAKSPKAIKAQKVPKSPKNKKKASKGKKKSKKH